MTRLLTNSALAAFRRCPRLYEWRYVRGLRPLIQKDEALGFGTLFHKALEHYWHPEEVEDNRAAAALGAFGELDPFERAYAEELMGGYALRWANDGLERIAVEQKFLAPIVHPDTGEERKGWLLAGKVDGIARQRSTGRAVFIEHKTAGVDIAPGCAYWVRLRLDSQVGFYTVGARVLGYPDATCIYDVVRKPDLDPLEATPLEKLKRRKDGAPYANQRLAAESAWEYRGRIQAAISKDPERYYQRAEVVRLEEEQRLLMLDAWAYVDLIERCESGLDGYPRNPDACFSYGRACDYWRICSGTGSAEDGTFTRVADVHPELGE